MKNQPGEKPSKSNWLQYVTEQSWEPELLISGLAIYATIQLPDLLWKGYQYYQYNLQSGSGLLDEVLPILIYCLFTTVAYILAFAFITHFVIRAFWVGFIGLMSVYSDGIRYEDLPYSDLYKEEAKKKLGTAEQMAMRIDNISSLIFSIAFVIVLIMIAVAIVYFGFFLLYNVLKLFLGPEIFNTYARVLYYSLTAVGAVYIGVLLILNLKRFRSNPKAAKWHLRLSWKLNEFIMPIVYKPVQFISLTFLSHISTKRFIGYYLGLMLVFLAVLMGVMFNSFVPDIFDARNFYATRADVHRLNPAYYSENIGDDELLPAAAIDQPVAESNFLSVFIPYPKLLDEKLNVFCDHVSPADSLEKFQIRRMKNEHRIDCAERFLSFTIDDSLKRKANLFFGAHPKTDQQGFQTYLDIENLAGGSHVLRVSRRAVDKADSTRLEKKRLLTFENEIPFWKK